MLGGCTWGHGDGRELLLKAVVGWLHPRVRGASRSAELELPWLGGCLEGKSITEDRRGVAVTENPEALVAGMAEGASTEAPEALLVGTVEVFKTVTGIPEAVDTEIPEAPTSCSGRCLGSWQCPMLGL